MLVHAYVITHDASRWKGNVKNLVDQLYSKGLSVQILSDQPNDIPGGRAIWLWRFLVQEAHGILVTFWASRDIPSPAVRLRRAIFSIFFASHNFFRFLAKQKKSIRIQKLHHILTMKHLEAIETFLEDKDGKVIMVFEDDAGTKHNFVGALAEVEEVCSGNSQPTVVNLCSNFGIPGREISGEGPISKLPTSMFGFDTTVSYALSRSAAEIISEQLKAQLKLRFISVDWSFTTALSRHKVVFLSSDICENLSLVSGYSSLDSPVLKRKSGI